MGLMAAGCLLYTAGGATPSTGPQSVLDQSLGMDRYQKLFVHIQTRKGDASVPFVTLCQLLCRLGFDERIKGDHHVFTMQGVQEILNLQPKGAHAKPYQVKQVRAIILRYGLTLGD